MNAFCGHCGSNIPTVWLLQGPDGQLAILADGEVFALDVTRTVQQRLRPLTGFGHDARVLAHGPHLEVRERIQVEDEHGWPAGMWPIAVWEAGRPRLLRDPDELDDTARAYLWPHQHAPLLGDEQAARTR